MGQAIVKADLPQVCEIVDKWIAANGFTLVSDFPDTSGKTAITAQNRVYKAVWELAPGSGGMVVSMDLSLRPYLSRSIHLTEIFGLLYVIYQTSGLLERFTFAGMWIFLATVFPLIVIFWWQAYRLSLRLDKIEKTFWDILSNSYDLAQIKRYEGHLINPKHLLPREILMSFLVVAICEKFFGFTGLLSSALLCTAILSLITIRQITSGNPQTHWRFWIVDNMFAWFAVILATLGLLAGLSMIEVIVPLEGKISSPAEVLRNYHFRNISPANSNLLEENCRQIMFETLQNRSEEAVSQQLFRKFSFFYSASLMAMMTCAVYFFSYRPLKSIFKKANVWNASTSRPMKQ